MHEQPTQSSTQEGSILTPPENWNDTESHDVVASSRPTYMAPGAYVGGSPSSVALRPSAYLGTERFLEERRPDHLHVLFVLDDSVGSSYALEYAVKNGLVHKSNIVTIMLSVNDPDVRGKRNWYGFRKTLPQEVVSRIYTENNMEQDALMGKFTSYLANHDIIASKKLSPLRGKKFGEVVLANIYETNADLVIFPFDNELLSEGNLSKDKLYVIEKSPAAVLAVTGQK